MPLSNWLKIRNDVRELLKMEDPLVGMSRETKRTPGHQPL